MGPANGGTALEGRGAMRGIAPYGAKLLRPMNRRGAGLAGDHKGRPYVGKGGPSVRRSPRGFRPSPGS